jgi:hypothetical protein
MEHRTTERPSDEVPFLADDEKDRFTIRTRPSRWQKWASLLPYSGLLNVILTILLLASWVPQRRDTQRAYIPSEIYCKEIPIILD